MDRLEAKSTVLSILRGTTAEDAATREKSLNRFCDQYNAPLIGYLHVVRRIPMDDVEDLVHDFWPQKLLEPPASQNIVAKYLTSTESGPSRGFRRFIFRSLANFQLDHARKAQRRRPILSLEQLEGWQPADNGVDEAEFDLVCAQHVLSQVVEEVRNECENKCQLNMWRLFVSCVLPHRTNMSQPLMSELALIHGFYTAKQASTALITVARKFDRAMLQYFSTKIIRRSCEVEVGMG